MSDANGNSSKAVEILRDLVNARADVDDAAIEALRDALRKRGAL